MSANAVSVGLAWLQVERPRSRQVEIVGFEHPALRIDDAGLLVTTHARGADMVASDRTAAPEHVPEILMPEVDPSDARLPQRVVELAITALDGGNVVVGRLPGHRELRLPE